MEGDSKMTNKMFSKINEVFRMAELTGDFTRAKRQLHGYELHLQKRIKELDLLSDTESKRAKKRILKEVKMLENAKNIL